MRGVVSQEKFANDIAYIPQSHYSDYERGVRTPHDELIRRVAMNSGDETLIDMYIGSHVRKIFDALTEMSIAHSYKKPMVI